MSLVPATKWVRLPTAWVQAGGLKTFRWIDGQGADNLAALIVLIAIAQRADQLNGSARVTYSQIGLATGLSRALISKGFQTLVARGLVVRDETGRTTTLANFDPTSGWGKLPASGLYDRQGTMPSFSEMQLRSHTELNAAKIYLLLIARRSNDTNLASISYDKIVDYTGIDRSRIKSALSMAVLSGLIHVERFHSTANLLGVSSAYRISHIDTSIHMGTRGRGITEVDFDTPF